MADHEETNENARMDDQAGPDQLCDDARKYQGRVIDYHNQRGILLGNSIPKLWTFNIFEGVSDDDVRRITAKCVDAEREHLLAFGREIPCGLLPVIGAPGVGKTTALCVLAELQLAAGKTVLATASQNPAVANFMQRIQQEMGPSVDTDFLFIRLWSPGMEYRAAADGAEKDFAKRSDQTPVFQQARLYKLEETLAGKVLMLCNVLPTQNKKLLRMRNCGAYSSLITAYDVAKRSDKKQKDGETNKFLKLMKSAMIDILANADFICTTLTQCESELGRIAVNVADYCIVDEACAATEIEVLQAWKGDTPVALGGDPRQLPPTVLVANVRNTQGNPYSCFVNQSKYSLAERLVFNGWPYWKLGTQLRICPGGWDMTCEILYKDSPRYGRQTLADFPIAISFESWLATLKPHRTKNSGSLSLAPSPAGKVYPAFFHVANTCCHREPGGMSRRNTQIVQACLGKLLELIEYSNGTITMSDIVIIVPYLAQSRLYLDAKLKDRQKRFEALTISTPNTFQGFESNLAVVDLTVAENVSHDVGWVSDRRRLAVSTTRHCSALMIIGDIFTFGVHEVIPGAGTPASGKTPSRGNDGGAQDRGAPDNTWSTNQTNGEDDGDEEDHVIHEEEEKKQQKRDVRHLKALLKWCVAHKRVFVQDSEVLAKNGSETFVKQLREAEIKLEQEKWDAFLANNVPPDPEDVIRRLREMNLAPAAWAPAKTDDTAAISVPVNDSEEVTTSPAPVNNADAVAGLPVVDLPVVDLPAVNLLDVSQVVHTTAVASIIAPIQSSPSSAFMVTGDIAFLTCNPGILTRVIVDDMMRTVEHQAEFNVSNFLGLKSFHRRLSKHMEVLTKFQDFAYELFLVLKKSNVCFTPSDCLLHVTELCLGLDDLDYEDESPPLTRQSALVARPPVASVAGPSATQALGRVVAPPPSGPRALAAGLSTTQALEPVVAPSPPVPRGPAAAPSQPPVSHGPAASYPAQAGKAPAALAPKSSVYADKEPVKQSAWQTSKDEKPSQAQLSYTQQKKLTALDDWKVELLNG